MNGGRRSIAEPTMAMGAPGNVGVSAMLGSLREAVKGDDGPGAASLVTAHIEGFYKETGPAG